MPDQFLSYNNKPALLEVYLKYIDTIEKNSDRRSQMNRYNLSLLLALGAAYGVSFSEDLALPPQIKAVLDYTVPAALFVLSLVWIFQILRFREVSRTKFKVLGQLEKSLDISCFQSEEAVTKETSSFIEYTQLELAIPLLSLAASAWLFFH